GDQYIKLSIDFAGPEINAPKDVDLTMEEEEIKMQVPDDLLFDFDENKLKSEAKETLDEIIEDLSDLGSERSEEHTSELQSRFDLVCRLLLEKKNKYPLSS